MIFEAIINILKKVKSTFLSGNFIKFCLFGIINTFNTSLFSWIFSLIPFVQANIAGILGYILSLQGAFLLTCKFIFKSKPALKKYTRFIISYIPSFIMYILIHAGALGALKLPQFWASFMAVMLSGPLTFAIVKIYAFNETAQKKKYEED
ncbi:MAG: GtrA family protein [Clostridia bacterium]|nr:GtrA family protein [Clostridia bacterium]